MWVTWISVLRSRPRLLSTSQTSGDDEEDAASRREPPGNGRQLPARVPRLGFGVCRGREGLAEQVWRVPPVPAVPTPRPVSPSRRHHESRTDTVTPASGPALHGVCRTTLGPVWVCPPPTPQQISPSILNLRKSRQISGNLAKSQEISPNRSKSHRISGNLAKLQEISPNLSKSR